MLVDALPRVRALEPTFVEQQRAAQAQTSAVDALLAQYNELVHALTLQCVAWHERLTQIERASESRRLADGLN